MVFDCYGKNLFYIIVTNNSDWWPFETYLYDDYIDK